MSESKSYKSLLFLLVAAGGVLLGFSFPPFPFPLAALVVLLPLLSAWYFSRGPAEALLYGLTFYLAAFGVAFSWPLMHEMPSAALASAAPLLAMLLVLSLPVAISFGIRRRLGIAWGLVAFVCLHLVAEALLSRGPLAIPGTFLGYTMAEIGQLRPLASISGVSGISAWILLINVLLFGTAVASANGRLISGGLAVALVAAGWFGSPAFAPENDATSSFDVSVVQPSLAMDIWADVPSRQRVEKLAHLTDSLLSGSAKQPDVVVWPETSLPPCSDSEVCPDVREQIRVLFRQRGPALVAGAITAVSPRDTPRPAGEFYFNSAFLVRGADVQQRYDKRRLVPFAEGVPFADRVPALASFSVAAGGVPAYVPGRHQIVFNVDERLIGTLICFESLFPQDARAYVRAGADALVVLSQDGWWGRSAGYRQHLAFTRMRAAETHRPVIFSAATGSSAIIGPGGEFIARMAFGEQAALTASVPLGGGTSHYVRFGDWISVLAGILAILVTLTAILRRRAGRSG